LDDALAILRDDMAPLISRAEGLRSNLVNAVRDRKNRGCLRYSFDSAKEECMTKAEALPLW
jgi:hypothetical protein